MRIAGILCEYNPFHIGHYEQIRIVKQQAEYVICLMSASFVQRGEPAMFDKFARASWALQAGADAVVELPCLFSLRSAQGFATGAMRLFSLIGIDTLYFGSECDLSFLESMANIFEAHPPEFDAAFHCALDRGLSYAAAREQAARNCIPGLPDMAFLPNAVLGTEYLLALRRLKSEIKPVALPRISGISASTARRLIESPDWPEKQRLNGMLPDYTINELSALTPVTAQAMSSALLYKLRSMRKDDFAQLPDISEGLENRLYAAGQAATNYDELLRLASLRRMPLSRIKRAFCCALLGIDQSMVDYYDNNNPTYLRLLGMRKNAKGLINHMAEHSGIPVVTQPAHHPQDAMLQKEIFATDVHALFANLSSGLDFTRRLITV